jgi:ubiquinone/menaquinone biosynthesis C-methylase UbiE
VSNETPEPGTDSTGHGHSNADRSPTTVRDVYDEIATHFSKTRVNPWPEVESFLSGRSASTGLDIGCGNARHTESLLTVTDRTIGLDLSRNLLAEATERVDGAGVVFLQGDAATLALASDTVDIALYVATLHHLPDRMRRVRSLDEMARVLDGVGFVSAWSTTHDRFDTHGRTASGFDTTIDWTLPDGDTVPRFYHIYAPDEFERDLVESNLTVERVFVSSGNCYARVRA